MQSRLLLLIKVVYLKGTMLSVSDKCESVNDTDQQKNKLHILEVRRNCRWINYATG